MTMIEPTPPEVVRVEKVLLAAPRGFCAGVEMAIKALAWMVRVFDPPVYCYHEIVHNQLVVDRFRGLGVVFVDDIAEVPAGAPVMLSAHGSAPEVVAAAREEGRFVVNAVCPLVTKVHHEAKVRAGKGFTIVYVGHEGHGRGREGRARGRVRARLPGQRGRRAARRPRGSRGAHSRRVRARGARGGGHRPPRTARRRRRGGRHGGGRVLPATTGAPRVA